MADYAGSLTATKDVWRLFGAYKHIMLLNFIKSFSICSNCKRIAASFIVKHLGRVHSCSVMPNGAFEHSPEYRCLRFGRGLLALCGLLVQEALRGRGSQLEKNH